MGFKEKLFDLRQKNGMTQAELASKLNTTRQSISKWETGLSFPSFEKINQLCEIFECTKDELIIECYGENKYDFDKNLILGNKIKYLREKNGISQEQLADKINVSRQTIFNYEKNITKPDISKLIELSKLFDISLESLLDEGKEKNNRDTKKCTNFLFIFLFFISVLFMCFQIDILYLIIINLVVSVGKLVLIVIKKGKIKFKEECIYIFIAFSIIFPNLFEFNSLNTILGTGFFKNFFLFSIPIFCIFWCFKFDKVAIFHVFIYLPLISISVIKNAFFINLILGMMLAIISIFINIFSIIKIIRYDLIWHKKIIIGCFIIFVISMLYLFNIHENFNYFFNLFIFILLILISGINAIIRKESRCNFIIYFILLIYNIFPLFSVFMSVLKNGTEYIVNEINVVEIISMMITLCIINLGRERK